MRLRALVSTALAAAAATFALLAPTQANAAEVIKIGTLHPASSPWGQVFKTWGEAVKQKSGGAVELQFFYNGSQGDEAAMVAKIKAGQLDGAAVSGVGLGKTYKPVLALQMPGLFTSWTKLDAARDGLKGDFEKGMKEAGFANLGWFDVGLVHAQSKGVALRTPDDLKGKKPWYWRDDASQSMLFGVIGGVTSVPLNVPEVLPSLNTGAINVMFTSSLFSEQLQWSSKLDTITADAIGVEIGGIVVSSKRLDGLAADKRTIVIDTGKVAANALTKRIRNEDAAAFGRLKAKMTVVTWSADEQTKWSAIFKATRTKLASGTFPADLVTKLEGYAK